MGWWGEPWTKGTSLQKFLKDKYTQDGRTSQSGYSMEPVFYSKSGFGTHFLGVKQTDREGKVSYWLAVVLVRFTDGGRNILTKDIDESMGPTQDAPDTVLKWLAEYIPEPPNKWAADWRARSAAANEKLRTRRSDFAKANRAYRSGTPRATVIADLQAKGYAVH